MLLCALLVISTIIIMPNYAKSTEINEVDTNEENDMANIDFNIEPLLVEIPIQKCLNCILETPPETTYTAVIPTGKTIYVDDDYTDDPVNHKWNTIKEALEDAEDGDTIIVYDGIYYEYNLIINKSISLIGNGATTIIDAGYAEWRDAMHVLADNVLIDGFKIINADDDAIEVEGGNNVIIRNCIFENNLCGIFLGCAS